MTTSKNVTDDAKKPIQPADEMTNDFEVLEKRVYNLEISVNEIEKTLDDTLKKLEENGRKFIDLLERFRT